MTQLIVQQVTKSYPTRGEPLEVLRGVDLQLTGGDNVAVVGPSGSGKSTLMNVLGTLDQPTSGSVRLDEVDPFALESSELAHFRNRNIGFIFQDHHLLPQLSALENVLVPSLAEGRATASLVEHAEQLLQTVGLQERRAHRPAELSGGERQRVAIARALLFGPKLLLADEPTGNLDPVTAASVADLLLGLPQLASRECIMVSVTHSLELAGRMQLCFQMTDGRLTAVERNAE